MYQLQIHFINLMYFKGRAAGQDSQFYHSILSQMSVMIEMPPYALCGVSSGSSLLAKVSIYWHPK